MNCYVLTGFIVILISNTPEADNNFWQYWITLRIIWFQDFFHRLEFRIDYGVTETGYFSVLKWEGLSSVIGHPRTERDSVSTILLCVRNSRRCIEPEMKLFLITFRTPVVTIWTTMFNIQQFYVLPTQCIYVFCVDLRTNSDYFTVQH
jgi:hypothetical protein